MMDASAFVDALEQGGVRFFVGVPDSYLHGFCSELQRRCEPVRNVIAANEGNAVAIAVGHYLATGSRPLVYMQNSGLGNAVNPLASLANPEMLGIPLILLIGWRGDPYHEDHVQHALQGRITPTLLDSLGIPFIELRDGEDARLQVAGAISLSERQNSPIALLAPKGVLNGVKKPTEGANGLLSREAAIELVLDAAPSDALFSATTGRAARELFHLRERRGEGHEHDYLNVGSMGHASSVALGMALSLPDRRVVCLDGDAALIMHMGALAVTPRLGVRNFLHVALNNGYHESVGGQPSAGWDVDFTTIAHACGYATIGHSASKPDEITSAVRRLCAGPAAFLDIRVRCGIRDDLPGLEVNPRAMRDSVMAGISRSTH